MIQTFSVPEKFETDRLLLRKPVLDDAPVLFDAYTSDPDISYYMTWRAHETVGQTRAFLAFVLGGWDRGDNHEFVIELRTTPGVPIGMIGMHSGFASEKRFGYVLARKHWGQGIMTEALTHLVEWSLRQSGVWRASVFCDADNAASIRAIEKSGLMFEGILRKYCMSPNISPEPRDVRLYAKVR